METLSLICDSHLTETFELGKATIRKDVFDKLKLVGPKIA